MKLIIPKFLIQSFRFLPFVQSLLIVSLIFLPFSLYYLGYIFAIINLWISFVSFGYVLIFESIYRYWGYVNKKYLKKTTSTDQSSSEYIGLVIPTSNVKWWHYAFTYGSGAMLLIESFKNKSIPFKILTNFNKEFNKDDFKKMVFDKNCTELYILGHGVKHGLEISKKEIMFYCDFCDAPKEKKKVIQLHCNHKGGKSLAEYLNADTDFKTEEKRHVSENIRYCLEKYNQFQKK